MTVGSATEAAEAGLSLALIRPRNTRFVAARKSTGKLEQEREAYRSSARQKRFFDTELAELEPSPFEFRFQFDDQAGRHTYSSGDWESHAMFWRERQRKGEAEALRWMYEVFNDIYPVQGMAFAIGNMLKRPNTWQLLGVIRLDETDAPELPL